MKIKKAGLGLLLVSMTVWGGEDLTQRLYHITGTHFSCEGMDAESCTATLKMMLSWNWTSTPRPGGEAVLTPSGVKKDGKILTALSQRLAEGDKRLLLPEVNQLTPKAVKDCPQCMIAEAERAKAEKNRLNGVAVDQIFKAITTGPNPHYFRDKNQIVRFSCTHAEKGDTSQTQRVTEQVWEYDRLTGASRFFAARPNQTPAPGCGWDPQFSTQNEGKNYDLFAVGHGIFSFSKDCKNWSADYQWQTAAYRCPPSGGKGQFGDWVRGKTRFSNGGAGVSEVDSEYRTEAQRTQVAMLGERSCQADSEQVMNICKSYEDLLKKCAENAPPIVTGTTMTCPSPVSDAKTGGSACLTPANEWNRRTGAPGFTIKSCRETAPGNELLRDTFLVERYEKGTRYAYGAARLHRSADGKRGTLEYPWEFENQKNQFIGLPGKKINGVTRIQVGIQPDGNLQVSDQCIRLEYSTVEGGSPLTLQNVKESERASYASAAPAPGIYKIECMEK